MRNALLALACYVGVVCAAPIAVADEAKPPAQWVEAVTSPVPPEAIGAAEALAPAPAGELTPEQVDDLFAFLTAVGGGKGLGALAGAAGLVQALMVLLRSKLKDKPMLQLGAVTGLSLLLGPALLSTAGVTGSAAVLHSLALAAFQVFGHQAFKQLVAETTKR